MDDQLIATFSVGEAWFGVDALHVQEVLRALPMTPVPLAPREVSGLINLRGQVVVALELRRRLGIEERPADRSPMNVVVRTDDGPVSFLVDEIGDVIDVPADRLEPPPETVSSIDRELISGIHKLDDRLLLLLDIDRTAALPVGR